MYFPFKITRETGGYRFIHIKAEPNHRTIQDSNLQLQVYLTLVSKLSIGLNCYALLPFSPEITTLWPKYSPVNYLYQFLADDFLGLGVDNGFQRLNEGSARRILIPMKDLMTLRSIPEDSLGDNASEVTVFLLCPGRKAALDQFLQSADTPSIDRFLRKKEIIVHLTCGKEQGYFDGMMIRSQSDVTAQIKAAIQQTQTAEFL